MNPSTNENQAYLGRRASVGGSGGDSARAAAAGPCVAVSAAAVGAAATAGSCIPGVAAATAASGGLSVVGAVVGGRGRSGRGRAVPLD
jgi:hypothetical protein